MKKRILVLASGSKTGGGSGYECLYEGTRDGRVGGEIVGVVSNHQGGGVEKRSERFGTPFVFMDEFTADAYQNIVASYRPDLICLSGWLKKVSGLDPRIVINIHSAPLPGFGGQGMYGHYAHEAVMAAYHRSEITHSAVTMHFVDSEYDKGPVFFRYPVSIRPDDTAETLAKRVNYQEHYWQPMITNLVLQRQISWDGENPESLRLPPDYKTI